jgi:hypothetical protein
LNQSYIAIYYLLPHPESHLLLSVRQNPLFTVRYNSNSLSSLSFDD